MPCRDWEVVRPQISLSPRQSSKITVVQSLLVATVTFQGPTSCDGNKTLTVGLGGQPCTLQYSLRWATWLKVKCLLHQGRMRACWLDATAAQPAPVPVGPTGKPTAAGALSVAGATTLTSSLTAGCLCRCLAAWPPSCMKGHSTGLQTCLPWAAVAACGCRWEAMRDFCSLTLHRPQPLAEHCHFALPLSAA